MPFVEGESLRDLIAREKQLPVDDVMRIAGEVADALSYAHERGVVHRDNLHRPQSSAAFVSQRRGERYLPVLGKDFDGPIDDAVNIVDIHAIAPVTTESGSSALDGP